MPPMAKRREATKMQVRGEKVWASLAANGEQEDIAIYCILFRTFVRVFWEGEIGGLRGRWR